MIRTREEAEEWCRLVNKHTACSAQVREDSVPVGQPYTQEWTAILHRTITDKIVCVLAREKGRKFRPLLECPQDVREYLLLVPGEPARLDVTREWFDTLVASDDISKVEVRYEGIERRVTFKMRRQRTRRALGIAFSCEVGESGDGPGDWIALPATELALSTARAQIEAYAEELEVETGWVEREGC
jgi:hypothetical protein